MSIKITIPKPCHENWNGMTPEAQGRFCHSCQKSVIDFTQWPDRSIAEKIHSGGNLCGRFLNSQPDRELIVPKQESTIWTAGIAGIFSFMNIGNDLLYAQQQTETIQIDSLSSFVQKNRPVPPFCLQ